MSPRVKGPKACVLVVAPQALLPAYAKENDAHAPLRCVARAQDLLHCLDSEHVVAVVHHEAPPLNPDVVKALTTWYQERRRAKPLLAVVTDLGSGYQKDFLHQCASLLFSRYHSRPQEIIALVRQWAFPKRNSH